MAMEGDVVTVERVIAAPPEAIFDLLADAGAHARIDGSGSVQQVRGEAPQRLALGRTFGMSMRIGVPYSMANTVTEFEEDRRIAWQARPPGVPGRFFAGRTWRYELEPVAGGTLVRESWDVSTDHQRAFLKLGSLPERTRRNMEATLRRIEELVTQ
jgi:uncharacterized protein YndB with AHSA1/START domain